MCTYSHTLSALCVFQVSEQDFMDSVLVLGFPEDLNKELLHIYQENCKEIRAVLSEMTLDLPHYQDLEWRCDIQLASRSLQRQAQPSVLLRLHTKQRGEAPPTHSVPRLLYTLLLACC